MATTTRGIPYPDDYSQAADIPAALENLAETVDDLVTAVDTKASSAQTAATTADSKAVAASSAVAAHTHDGATSTNIAIAAVTGLTASLAGKAGTEHTHPSYAAVDHSHTAQEIAAHTHTEYSVTAHTHTQAQSHTSPDTDVAAGSLHHTLGTGANQAAAGNHTHSGYASSTHTHEGYSASSHLHSGTYSVEGHTHSGYAATDHNHNTAYATTSHTHEYAPTSHTHAYAATSHQHTSFSGSLSITGSYSSNAMKTDTSSNAPNVRVDSGGEIKSTSYNVSAQRFKVGIVALDGTDLSDLVEPRRLGSPDEVSGINPYAVLDLTPIRYRWELNQEDDATGFLAEDVAAKFPTAALHNEEGQIEGVDVRGILSSLILIVREQQARIDALEARQA